ncbi:MAG: TolC family protein [Bacteriovoracia bacterium]
MNRPSLFIILVLSLGIAPRGWGAPAVLTLEQYLNQVREQNTGVRAATSARDAARDRVGEGETLLAPTLFAQFQWADDRAPKDNPTLQGTRTVQNSYQFGVSKQTTFGLFGRFYYTTAFTGITGADASFVPFPEFYTAKPTLEFSQSLWRNFFGRETRAQVAAIEASAQVAHETEGYRARAMLVEAEAAYWRLAAAREVLAVQRASLDRAKKILDWSSSRVRSRLADRSDLFQSDAGYKLRNLEFNLAEDEARAAEMAFNSVRNVPDAQVKDALTDLDQLNEGGLEKQIDKLSGKGAASAARDGRRGDVEAAFHAERAAVAAANLAYEKNQPTLELYGALSLNGRDISSMTSVSQSFRTDQAATAVGLRFSMPLNLGTTADIRKAYRTEAMAAEGKLARAQFEEERDWQDIHQKLAEAKRRYLLAKKIESTQKEKYEHERQRHAGGRSTTFLVLQFEQDYAQAQILRLRSQVELLGLSAQMKLYSPEGDTK